MRYLILLVLVFAVSIQPMVAQEEPVVNEFNNITIITLPEEVNPMGGTRLCDQLYSEATGTPGDFQIDPLTSIPEYPTLAFGMTQFLGTPDLYDISGDEPEMILFGAVSRAFSPDHQWLAYQSICFGVYGMGIMHLPTQTVVWENANCGHMLKWYHWITPNSFGFKCLANEGS